MMENILATNTGKLDTSLTSSLLLSANSNIYSSVIFRTRRKLYKMKTKSPQTTGTDPSSVTNVPIHDGAAKHIIQMFNSKKQTSRAVLLYRATIATYSKKPQINVKSWRNNWGQKL
jgi:hypothetical protein